VGWIRAVKGVEPLSTAIALSAVSKTFGATKAIDALDLEVPQGGLYGFIGPNGAGKTTTIRIVMSILLPDSGRVCVLGHASALGAKDRIGYLPEERGTYRKMRVGAFLQYMGRLKGVHSSIIAHRARIRLERLGLAEYENKRCEELSWWESHRSHSRSHSQPGSSALPCCSTAGRPASRR